ncbi:MAG: acetyl-CoA carboxylase, carboxyltransferase subunit beta [Alphaproteobacteria bacterium]|nr:acetyl-CoA carboxylase, carboxyltransferase subunit beta [Alphaproteobacteria bacterium]
MNWLTNAVLPKIQALVGREMPDNLWHKCPACGQMIFHADLATNHRVCSECDHHMRLPPMERLKLLFDGGLVEPIELGKPAIDPLKFRDRKRYSDRLREAQSKTGRNDAIVVAHGTIEGNAAVVAAFDFDFMGGSMGSSVGEGLVRAAKLAETQDAALIIVPSSGGARMQEGILSLMQMPRTVAAVERFKETGRPFVVLLTDPTTGGVTASFAMLGDLHISEPGAIIGFAGQRVIQETIREQLPEGFQKAEYLLEHGMVDAVVHRHKLKQTLGGLLGLLMDPEPKADVVKLDPASETPASKPVEANASAPMSSADRVEQNEASKKSKA